MNAYIMATGSYLPDRVLTNFDLEQMVDTSDEWIVQRTGVRERHIASKDELTSDLAYKAADDALNKIGMSPSEIELIIVATVFPDKLLPSTALFVQDKLGATNAFCFDINAACSGFMYSLGVANAYIKSGIVKNALVIGSEEMSKVIDWTDRTTCVIFGDGAACAILGATEDEQRGILSIRLGSDGSYHHLMHIPALGSAEPCSEEAIRKKDIYVKMRGNETFKLAVRYLVNVSKETLADVGMGFEDVDWFIPHQANVRIMEGFARRIGVPVEKVIMTIDRHGNTAGASIPLALDDAVESGRVKRGDIVVLNSFGASLTWSASVIRW